MAKPGWQLSRRQRMTYSVGMFSSAIITANVMAWMLYFYAPPPNMVDKGMIFLGAGLAVGLARLISSMVDAFANPLVAFWSDRSTNPKGRRIPFIVRGTFPLMLFAILVWFPPVRGASIANVVWLGVTLSGAWFFYTYVVAPYLALMPEITENPEERVSLTVTMSYWEAGATLIAALAIPPVIEALRGGLQLGPFYLADGFKTTAILLAIVGAAGFFISVSRIKEKKLSAERITKFSLVRSVVECFRNPAFPPYLFAVAFAKVGIGLVLISMPFLATAVLHKGEGFAAVLQAPLFLAIIGGFVLAEILVNRVGLKKAFLFATGVATFLVFAFFGSYFLGGEPKELLRTWQSGDGDIVFAFGEPGGKAPELSEAALAALPRHSSEDDVTLVRVPSLEWRAFFQEADEEALRAAVTIMSEEEAAALLRADTAEERDLDGGSARDWLLAQPAGVLVAHLVPEKAGALFSTTPKRRFDDNSGLYVQLRGVQADGTAAAPVRLDVVFGTVHNPEETFNVEGWTNILSDAEHRASQPPVAQPTVEDLTPVVLQGEVIFTDGSLLVGGFRPLDPPEGAASPILKALGDTAHLDHLMSLFDMRVEFAWSVRIYVVLLLFLFLGFPAAILMSMYRPIVCEIVDHDEQRVGYRREAMYFGVEGLLTKGADGISAIVAPGVMLLGHLLAPPPFGYVVPFAAAAVFMLLGFLIFRRYPLGKPTLKRPEEGQGE